MKHEHGWEGAAPKSDVARRGCSRVDAVFDLFFFFPSDSCRLGFNLRWFDQNQVVSAELSSIGRRPKRLKRTETSRNRPWIIPMRIRQIQGMKWRSWRSSFPWVDRKERETKKSGRFFIFVLERGEERRGKWCQMWSGCVFCYELWEGLFEDSGSYSAFIDEVCVCVRTIEALWLYLV